MIRRGLVTALCGLLLALTPGVPAGADSAAAGNPAPASVRSGNPPVLAYYYMWFNPTSWQRGKKDRPALGPYSSVERRVTEQHVRWAKAAGIEGFLVSWKRTETLDYRLERLVQVARRLDFKLGIVYQGLDFDRQPLPVQRVVNDLSWFADTYGDDPTFHVFGAQALVVWSGTWKFSEPQVQLVSSVARPRLTLLASERNPDDYESVASHFEGNAYYWGSVNPRTYPRYQQKLDSMGRAVHATGGLWIPPFAPGFDARLVGGTSVVPRDDGATLRTQWDTALASSPDALGLISWNEFSENTHIEPSESYGTKYLSAVADLTGSKGPAGELDSSAVPRRNSFASNNGIITLMVFLVLAVIAGVVLIRRRNQGPVGPRDPTSEDWA